VDDVAGARQLTCSQFVQDLSRFRVPAGVVLRCLVRSEIEKRATSFLLTDHEHFLVGQQGIASEGRDVPRDAGNNYAPAVGGCRQCMDVPDAYVQHTIERSLRRFDGRARPLPRRELAICSLFGVLEAGRFGSLALQRWFHAYLEYSATSDIDIDVPMCGCASASSYVKPTRMRRELHGCLAKEVVLAHVRETKTVLDELRAEHASTSRAVTHSPDLEDSVAGSTHRSRRRPAHAPLLPLERGD
jgi:hypothetical protein